MWPKITGMHRNYMKNKLAAATFTHVLDQAKSCANALLRAENIDTS